MPRKGENIYKRKDGRWEGRYIKGRTAKKAFYGYVYGKSYRDVRERLQEARTQWEQNAKRDMEEVEQVTFEEICCAWLHDSQMAIKESSAVKYKYMLRCYLLPTFGSRDIGEITTEDLISFIHWLRTEGGAQGQGLSAKTAADTVSVLKTIRKYALARNYPVQFLPECITVKQKQRQLRILSRQEEKRLYGYLQSNMTPSNLGILLCLFTGIRLGELCALKWEDISVTGRSMHICKTMQRIHDYSCAEGDKRTRIIISAPKSGCSVRTIPIPEILAGYLEQYDTPGTYVLTGHAGKYVEPRTMEYRFKNVTKACGIENVNFHALRHTFATRCVEVGFDAKSLSEILGHANVNITLNRYVHPTMELKRENMSRLSGLFVVK